MAATIKDIARHLNISVSTVSYALNGGPRNVPAEVKDKVFAVARDLNYRPNRVARSMITGRTHTIGIVPPEIVDNALLSPYLQLAINGISNEAGRLNQDILLFTRHKDKPHEEMLSTLVDGRADGVIFIAPDMGKKTMELATAHHLPCVIISGEGLEGVASFNVNNEVGMAQAMQHLYDLGHRKIAHVTGRLDQQDALMRLQSYKEFLATHGLPQRDEWIYEGRFDIEGGKVALKSFMNLAERPTAITCANDEMAIGALFGALDLGIKVPEDLSVVGFDAVDAGAHAYPPLTTVKQPIGELSGAAFRALNDLIEGRAQPINTVFRTELLIRSSTARPKEDSL